MLQQQSRFEGLCLAGQWAALRFVHRSLGSVPIPDRPQKAENGCDSDRINHSPQYGLASRTELTQRTVRNNHKKQYEEVAEPFWSLSLSHLVTPR
jgi:hypothetical protein